jgi:hypothetical protein
MAYPTFASFQNLIQENGISSSNIYDINFGRIEETNSSSLFKNLKTQFATDTLTYNPSQWLQFYTDEVTLPGEQVTTSTYKINNSPAYSYATDIVYPEISITFILDAYLSQKKIFDKWIEFIKPISNQPTSFRRMRLRYRDEYVSNITIEKYERYGNGKIIIPTKNAIPTVPVIPGSPKSTMPNNVLKYTTILHNAYPTTISSIPLNSGSSQLNRVSVTFKYEYPLYSSNSNLKPELEVIS